MPSSRPLVMDEATRTPSSRPLAMDEDARDGTESSAASDSPTKDIGSGEKTESSAQDLPTGDPDRLPMTFVIRRKAPTDSVGISLIRLSATHQMPPRLLVLNVSETALAAKAGILPRADLKSVAGRDVAESLGCSKHETEELFASLIGDIDVKVVRSRRYLKYTARHVETTFADRQAASPAPAAAPEKSLTPLVQVKTIHGA